MNWTSLTLRQGNRNDSYTEQHNPQPTRGLIVASLGDPELLGVEASRIWLERDAGRFVAATVAPDQALELDSLFVDR